MKLLALLILLPLNLFADKLIVGGVSKHFTPMEYDANELHPAVGYEWDTYEISLYKNSFENISLAFAYIDRPWKWGGLSTGYRVGVASGYKNKKYCQNKTLPILGEVCVPQEVDSGYHGFMPQAQFILSTNYKTITFDFGIGPVSTLVFKISL